MTRLNPLDIAAFEKFLLEQDNFLIVSHVNPDGDAVSSSLAIGYILKSLNKKFVIVNQDPYPKRFTFLKKYDLLKLASEITDKFTNVITVDTADINRLGEAEQLIAAKSTIVNIDHHLSGSQYGDINLVITTAASTTEVIYRLAKALDFEFTKEFAEYIYTGLLTDTGGFRYANTAPDTLQLAAELATHGIKPGELADRSLEKISLRYLKGLKVVLNNIEFYENETIIGSLLDYKSLKKLDDEADGIVSLLRNIDNVDISFLIKEDNPGKYRVSLRSNKMVDVSQVAAEFGGGGHFNASGFSYEGDLAVLKDRIVAKVVDYKKNKGIELVE